MRALFPSSLRRYAGIILDVAFDHYLARRWHAFCDVSRQSFIMQIYESMQCHPQLLPDRIRPLAPDMISRDFLNRCETMNGVGRVLSHLDARLSRGFDPTAAQHTLEANDTELQRGFTRVFMDVHRSLVSGPDLT